MQSYKVTKINKSIFNRRKMHNDVFWKNSPALTHFFYPWNAELPPATIFRALYDSKYLFFRFDVIDSDIHASKGSNDKMAVLTSDRVEIFFRSDSSMEVYYGLEMDPLSKVLDYKAEFYRKFDYNWTWKGLEIYSEFTLNGYRVIGCISQDSLRKLDLLKENKLECGLFRGKCLSEAVFKWISWVKPKSEQPDFHIPSAFGELVLGT